MLLVNGLQHSSPRVAEVVVKVGELWAGRAAAADGKEPSLGADSQSLIVEDLPVQVNELIADADETVGDAAPQSLDDPALLVVEDALVGEEPVDCVWVRL